MAAAKKPKEGSKAGGKKLADVAKPGTSAPSNTSRPIIVSNRPILQDPMMAAEPAADAGAASPETTAAKPSTTKLTIKPILVTSADDDNDSAVAVSKAASAEPAKAAETAATTESEVPAEKAAVTAPEPEDTPAPEAPAEPAEAATPVEPEAPAPEVDSEASSNDDESASTPPSAQSPEELETAAKAAEQLAAEHKAAIDKLAESRQYFLPIATLEQRKTKRFIALGAVIIIVLGLAWLDVALDAGLVHVSGIKAVTHFFTS